jgi:probable addiction module antidote protein
MTRSKNPPDLVPFDATQYLTDEAAIAEFLNVSLEMGDEQVLLHAVSTVARARGMTQLAKDAGLGRESLYKALAPGAKPRYDTVFKVIQALGVNIHFSPVGEPVHQVAEPELVYVGRARSPRKAKTAI